MGKLKILFLCTGNSCRSQMAEGWARHLKPEVLEPFSAGVDPKGLNQLAVQVMAEAGVDISNQQSKHIEEFQNISLDVVITVCGNAQESCPKFPGKTRIIHVGFDDPPKLADKARTTADTLVHYRRVRDEICDFVKNLPERLGR